MDPNLFHLDWGRTFELSATISVLAIFIERALSVVFEHRLFVAKLGNRGFKEVIAVVVSVVVCFQSAPGRAEHSRSQERLGGHPKAAINVHLKTGH